MHVQTDEIPEQRSGREPADRPLDRKRLEKEGQRSQWDIAGHINYTTGQTSCPGVAGKHKRLPVHLLNLGLCLPLSYWGFLRERT